MYDQMKATTTLDSTVGTKIALFAKSSADAVLFIQDHGKENTQHIVNQHRDHRDNQRDLQCIVKTRVLKEPDKVLEADHFIVFADAVPVGEAVEQAKAQRDDHENSVDQVSRRCQQDVMQFVVLQFGPPPLT